MKFESFPIKYLPYPARSFVEECASASDIDATVFVLPMLSSLAAAIGNSKRLRIKEKVHEPAILWTAIVGESGDGKSTGPEFVGPYVEDKERKAQADFDAARKVFSRETAKYEAALKKRESEKNQEPPTKPVEPVRTRFFTQNPTVESLGPILAANPRGLFLCRDELSGWLSSFDRYAKTTGGDVASWLSIYNGGHILDDRKSGSCYVHAAYVSITGTIQPRTLKRCFNEENLENGLASRFLLTNPPSKPRRWSEADISKETDRDYRSLVEKLYELKANRDQNGFQTPKLVDFSQEAKTLWIEFYDLHQVETDRFFGPVKWLLQKVTRHAARLALVHHCIRVAMRETSDENVIDLESVTAGVEMAKWFGDEAKRIYVLLDETPSEKETRDVKDFLVNHGGQATARDLIRLSKKWRTMDAAEAALRAAKKSGVVTSDTVPTNGRPVETFYLVD